MEGLHLPNNLVNPPPSNPNHNQIQAVVVSPSTKNSKSWFLDTGTIHHLSQSVDTLPDIYPYQGNDKVIVGNGKKLSILHLNFKS